MKERLIQLLDLEQLSPSKFADIIGVQRSSISHVLSGRNKPSFDFLQKTLKAFPGLNASWLIMGDGTMYEQMGRNIPGNLFDTPDESEEQFPGPISEEPAPQPEETPAQAALNTEQTAESDPDDGSVQAEAVAAAVAPGKKRIVQVMVIYEDDTFRAFTPAQ